MAVSLVDTSPYVYAAIGCFFLSACSSDLLILRLALTIALVFLALAAWSDYSADGSFSTDTMPFVDESIDLSLILYTILIVWNAAACLRILDDIRPRRKLLDLRDQALYNFFQRRCGLTRVEFDEVRRHGHYLELGVNAKVPHTDSTLYLVMEGLVECETQGRPREGITAMFPKRSGQFFDLKFFNIFSLPVGFDSLHFRATTATKTKLFGWSIRSLVAMRDSKSPALRPFWEFMILRSLARDSIRHHLQAADKAGTWPLPEDPEWFDGGPSYDFETSDGTRSQSHGRSSLFNILPPLPPKGIRNGPPSSILPRQGQQDCIEFVAKAKQDCMDRMEGEEGSWQNVLFVSTFGCFKESSGEENEEDAMSTPAKSNRMEEPTNSVNPIQTNSTMLPQQSSARIYEGQHYANVRQEDEATPRVANRYSCSSVQMRQQQPDVPPQSEGVPHLPNLEEESYVSVGVIEQQSTNATATSTELQEETKAEIRPEPMFESVWNKVEPRDHSV